MHINDTYTVAQVAQVLGVCKQTIRRHIDRGALVAELALGAYRIKPEALQAYLAGKGVHQDNIDRILRQLATTEFERERSVLANVAYMAGEQFAYLVVRGIAAIQQDPSSTRSNTEKNGYLQLIRFSPDAWPEEMQALFWAGFGAKKNQHAAPMKKFIKQYTQAPVGASAFQKMLHEAGEYNLGCMEDPEYRQDFFQKVANTDPDTSLPRTATPNAENNNDVQ